MQNNPHHLPASQHSEKFTYNGHNCSNCSYSASQLLNHRSQASLLDALQKMHSMTFSSGFPATGVEGVVLPLWRRAGASTSAPWVAAASPCACTAVVTHCDMDH